jgi:CubicO group peptidase (beta-lactamase class C family)
MIKSDATLADALRTVHADGIVVGLTSETTTLFHSSGSIAGEAVNDHTVMHGASVAKQFIGLLIAQAIEAGHATEDDQLIGLLPELPESLGRHSVMSPAAPHFWAHRGHGTELRYPCQQRAGAGADARH